MEQGQRVRFVRPHRDAYERLRECPRDVREAGETVLHVYKRNASRAPVEESTLLRDAVTFNGFAPQRPTERHVRQLSRKGVLLTHARPMHGWEKRATWAPLLRDALTRGVAQ